jgi:hypothetical protein
MQQMHEAIICSGHFMWEVDWRISSILSKERDHENPTQPQYYFPFVQLSGAYVHRYLEVCRALEGVSGQWRRRRQMREYAAVVRCESVVRRSHGV